MSEAIEAPPNFRKVKYDSCATCARCWMLTRNVWKCHTYDVQVDSEDICDDYRFTERSKDEWPT